MRRSVSWRIAAALALSVGGLKAQAAAPIYSFETLYDAPVGTNPPQPDPVNGTRPDDFHANGGGFTVAQDTVGATDGTFSLKATMVGGATFAGPLTELIPEAINDPNTTGLAIDITIPQTGSFTGNFARMGLKEFGVFQGSAIDAQTDPATGEANIALTPGTYTIDLPLIAAFNPITFDSNSPFSSIYGPDPNSQGTPTGFEFYINKSNDSPLTVYLDNVRALTATPANYPGDANGDGFVDATDFGILVNHYLTSTADGPADGDFDDSGVVDATDFGILVNHYLTGPNPPPGAALDASQAAVAVPEPASLAAFAAPALLMVQRRRRR